MVWIQRPDGDEHRQGFKLSEMEKAVSWSENGVAQASEHDAELAIDAGLAEPKDDADGDGDEPPDSDDSAGDEDGDGDGDEEPDEDSD